MQKDVTLVFHRQGLRSWIEVDLCPDCPRMDGKGCCGYYSPVFYLTDLVWISHRDPGFLDRLFDLPRLTVLDFSITVNSLPDVDDSFRCQFHSTQRGCLLPLDLRESVCRIFVCPGIAWWNDQALKDWKKYFDDLEKFEIALNNKVAQESLRHGWSLRRAEHRKNIIYLSKSLIDLNLYREVPFGLDLPRRQEAKLAIELAFGNQWPL